MFDAELYREKSEVEEWKTRDPIPAFTNYLLQQQWLSEPDLNEIESRVAKEVQEAVDYAETCSFEPVEELLKYTYSERKS